MSHLDWVNVAGYCASLLVFGAFYMTATIPLRAIAIASNIAFIAYGFGHDLYPVLILHALLLPLNCFRLMQLRRSSRRVLGECGDDPSNEWLIPLMSTHTFKSGDVLFQLYCQDPTFGLYLMRLVIQRMLVGERRRAARHRVRSLQRGSRAHPQRRSEASRAPWTSASNLAHMTVGCWRWNRAP
jgi:hypothetical protein